MILIFHTCYTNRTKKVRYLKCSMKSETHANNQIPMKTASILRNILRPSTKLISCRLCTCNNETFAIPMAQKVLYTLTNMLFWYGHIPSSRKRYFLYLKQRCVVSSICDGGSSTFDYEVSALPVLSPLFSGNLKFCNISL